MGNVNVNYLNGGIGGNIPSTDYISALMFDSDVLPSGFASDDRVKAVYSLQQAVALGITGDSSDETKATGGNVEITAVGTTGDVISVYIEPAYHAKILLGSYTLKSTDTTVSLIATGLRTAINLLTPSTGFSASGSSGNVALTAPAGLGEAINGSGITTTITSGSTITTTITDFSGGAGSKIDLMYYTLDLFFNYASQSKLYIGIYDFTSGFDESKIVDMQTYAKGSIKQMGILFTNYELSNITSLISLIKTTGADQASKHKPISTILMGLQNGDISGSIESASDLIDGRVSGGSWPGCVLTNSYGTSSTGYNLKGSTGYFPTALGAALGIVSRSKVSNSIAWVQPNNITYGNEFDEVMLVTGETWDEIQDTVLETEIENKGYIFAKKFVDYNGTYFANSTNFDLFTSDYNTIERRRAMDKVSRLSYTAILPYLGSNLDIDATTGQISTASTITLEQAIDSQLNVMINDGEISGKLVYIDPTQDVLTSKNIDVTITIVPVAIAENITLNLSYATSI